MIKTLVLSAAGLMLAANLALAQTAPAGVGTGASGTDQPSGSAVGGALSNAPAPVTQAPLPSGNQNGACSYGSPSNGGGPLLGGTTSTSGPNTGAATPSGPTSGNAAAPTGVTTPGPASSDSGANSASGGSGG